jgi:hypothetical protein
MRVRFFLAGEREENFFLPTIVFFQQHRGVCERFVVKDAAEGEASVEFQCNDSATPTTPVVLPDTFAADYRKCLTAAAGGDATFDPTKTAADLAVKIDLAEKCRCEGLLRADSVGKHTSCNRHFVFFFRS